MEVIASKRMGSMMLVVALILWSSIGADADLSHKLQCAFFCSTDPDPLLCTINCIGHHSAESLTFMASEHCEIGCFLSTCFDYHPDTKKFGVDVKKVGACADSCSEVCQKAYSLH